MKMVMEESDGATANVSLLSYRRHTKLVSRSKSCYPPLPTDSQEERRSRSRNKNHQSSFVSSKEDEGRHSRSQARRSFSLVRLFKRQSSTSSGYEAEETASSGVQLLSYHTHSYGRGRIVMEGAEKNSFQNGNERRVPISHVTPYIPPPAGFDSPTRPSTLLAALVRGPVSLDETTLSPATQRRLAFIQRHTHSSYHIRSSAYKTPSNDSSKRISATDTRSLLSKGEFWCDLPTSPLSPPSPFQHPFFRRQLGLLPPEPWSRFSGFGLPRLNPMFGEVASSTRSSSSQPEEEADESSKEVTVKKRTSRRAPKYHVSSTSSGASYCNESQSYKVTRETQFFSQTYSDSVSETESEDDEDNEPFTTSGNSQKKLLNNNHIQNNISSSSGEDVLPCSSTSPSSNNNSSNVSVVVGPPSPKLNPSSNSSVFDVEIESKRNSQAMSSEVDNDDVSSLTTSEPDSFHDAPSPRDSFHSTTYDGDQSKPPIRSCDESETPISQSEFTNKADKLHKIALELLHTEISYVNVLHIIDQEFQFRVDQQNRAHHLFPPDQMPLMFANIKSIYKLHHDFLLPQLEERMAQWDTNNKIGDIMKNFAPFLKMYTDYVRNFDNAMTLISNWQSKSPRFAAIMEEIHSLKSCGHLTLQHHMLSPVQRIPRYEMLLKDYLRKLPDDSPDRLETEEALHLVSTAANHANDAMKKIDKFQKLLEVQECLGGAIELVSPTRELLKEGRIIKISARSGDHQERYLFLFSDILLLCTPSLMGGRVISGPQYRLRARYKVENLQVLEGDNLETANTFYIQDSNKTVELYTQTQEEKHSWLNSLFQAIQETYLRKSSLRLASNSDSKVFDPDLGLKQPIMIRTDSVTKCMQCGSQFSVVRRKHHCRACGSVVCNKCSSHKVNLACESGKNVRVCRTCYETLTEMESGVSPSTETEEKLVENGSESRPDSMDSKKYESLIFKSRGVLEVSANDSGSIMEGFLQLKTHRKAWVKRWFALHTDFVLYSFKTDEDNTALTATPVPGFTVAKIQNAKSESGITEKDRDKSFKLHHAKKQYVFIASSKEDSIKWVSALQKASRAELPSPVE